MSRIKLVASAAIVGAILCTTYKAIQIRASANAASENIRRDWQSENERLKAANDVTDVEIDKASSRSSMADRPHSLPPSTGLKHSKTAALKSELLDLENQRDALHIVGAGSATENAKYVDLTKRMDVIQDQLLSGQQR